MSTKHSARAEHNTVTSLRHSSPPKETVRIQTIVLVYSIRVKNADNNDLNWNFLGTCVNVHDSTVASTDDRLVL